MAKSLSFEMTKKLVSEGDVNLYAYLGYLYINGYHGAPKDSAKGLFWLNRDIQVNQRYDSHLLIGLYYGSIENNEENLRLAFEHVKKATKANSPSADYVLGVLYATGEGCEINFDKAEVLFKKSADWGFLLAKRDYAKLQFLKGHKLKGYFLLIKNWPFFIFYKTLRPNHPKIKATLETY